ncbi:hypothetical protein [Dialister sp.]|uniref:hypothetical protein n=1 Tax=Dialister sp. TaxID=1955814 RepID=UPI002E80989F|nr:hypothetical protein [Dialister sp.]MEE3453403.1 hypothetical protein [Dialister sp.]
MEDFKNDFFLKDKGYFVIDCETDGLYGPFLTAAVIVTDPKLNVTGRYYYGASETITKAENPWVLEHVIPILGDYEDCRTEAGLYEKVWNLWLECRTDHYAVADVNFPVENRFFTECVKMDRPASEQLAPFPFLDLSGFLFQRGIDPLAPRLELSGMEEGSQHNALFDVEMTIAIMKNLRENKL